MNYSKILPFFFLHAINLLGIIIAFYSVAITVGSLWGTIAVGETIELINFLRVYGGILCSILLPIQLGLGVNAFLKRENPIFLLTVYFTHDQKELPSELLDPTKSNIGVLILVLLLIGGYIAIPVYLIFGLWTMSFLMIGINFYSIDDLLSIINLIATNVFNFAIGIPLLILSALVTISVITIGKRHRR
ncbi:MAG: hypothetical protein ACTSUV_03545 [Candidatus Ranarchaeia archaeon]